jgi:minor histocompatibility antigen H13
MTDAAGTPTTNYLLVASYGTIAALWVASQYVLIPYALHLLLLVTCILYVACHGSLILLQDEHEEIKQEDGTTVSQKVERETLKQEDAYQFPLYGSASLFSLYLAFRFLDKDLVNLLIGVYFGVVGCVAVALTLAPFLAKLTDKLAPKLSEEIRFEQQILHPFFKKEPIEWTVALSIVEMLAFVLSACICGLYFREKAWYMNNVLGICFCIQGIERFSLGKYKIAAILLIGLFFYDIFWVFGSEVMVVVAKSLDGPIKLLLPRTLEVNEATGKLKDLSLLGLGDIVIPGFFLALMLRFDAHKHAATLADKTIVLEMHDSFPKFYFHSTLIAYVLGLGTTLFVMTYFNAAQPALLYLVPACLGSSMLCAVVRGEVKELFDYSEEEEEEENSSEGENKAEKADSTKKDE